MSTTTQTQTAPPADAVASPAPGAHVPAATSPPVVFVPPSAPPPSPRRRNKRFIIIGVIAVVLIAIAAWIISTLNTVSTDDAYVNGHVTFVAPRVAGQVVKVYVDDNNRVKRGDILVQLDKEPYLVQLNIAQSAVDNAQADLVVAEANTRGLEGQLRSLRFALDHAIEDVDNQVALLRSKVATLQSAKATLAKAQADYDRAVPLVKNGAVSAEEFDKRKEALAIAQADVDEALEGVYQIRVSLGLPPQPEGTDDLTSVPSDLDQTFSTVRQAQYALTQTAAQLGIFDMLNISPKEQIADFFKRDPQGDLDRIYAAVLQKAPAIQQARTKLNVAIQDLSQAQLNLRYCDVVSDINGVVTNRDVNPGNNVVAGQSLMAVRSLTDIWVDANFKETQLADLRIGQEADLDVDMYGRRQHFKGRISGFTMGTGSTLALLPPENATGNFVKVVQRLPVRIDLIDYDPDQNPLFVGLSVTPTVYLNHPLIGSDAGKVLQPYLPSLPTTNPNPRADVDSTPQNTLPVPIDVPPMGTGPMTTPPADASAPGNQSPPIPASPSATANPTNGPNPSAAGAPAAGTNAPAGAAPSGGNP